jgi:hypothetical protein
MHKTGATIGLELFKNSSEKKCVCVCTRVVDIKSLCMTIKKDQHVRTIMYWSVVQNAIIITAACLRTFQGDRGGVIIKESREEEWVDECRRRAAVTQMIQAHMFWTSNHDRSHHGSASNCR